MKTFFTKMVAAVCLLVSMIATAEAQNSFAYQAVIRTAKGELVSNKEIGMQFSLIYDGKVVYSETQNPTTSQYGNVKVEVGKGQKVSGDFAAVPWSTMQVMMKIEADPNGGTDYIDLGTIQLQPAPYAMYATAAGMVNTVEAGEPKSDSDALFEVKDKDGRVVFAVYPDGVRVYVDDSASAKAISTGFAVSGRRAAKEGADADIFAVNTKGTQVFVDEDTAAKAVRTGFAVSGRRGAAKDGSADLFTVSSTGTQIYIGEQDGKPISTGFAVSGRRGAAKGEEKYLEINADGTRVYVDDDSTKAVRTGFAVSGRRAAKGENRKFMEISADGTKVYVDDADNQAGKPISTGFAVSGRRGAAKGKGVKLFEVNGFGTQIYIDTEKDKAQRTGFAVGGRRAAKKGEVTNKYMVIDADGTRIYVDYEEAKAMRTGFAVSGRKAAKDGTPNTILKVDNVEGTCAYIDDIDGKAMQTGFAVSGRKAAKEGAPDLLRITSGNTTLAAASLALQDKETDKDLMSISSKNTSISTDDFSLSNHEDKDVLTTGSGNVEVKNELVVLGDVAQTVVVDSIEDILPVYLAVGPKIDTVLCADTASALEAPNGYMLLKIYGKRLFAPNQNVDVEGNNVILFDANGNPVKQHSAAAAAVILAEASTDRAKLIVWPLKQTDNLEINFGLMAAGDTSNRYVPVTALINAGGPVECQVAVKSEDDSLGSVEVVGPKVYGQKVELTPRPAVGYHFTNWSDGRTANPRTALILHDTAFASANFEINTYNIKATAENGIVEICGEQNEDNTFNHGTEIELTAIADEHFHFMGWTDGEAAAERKFKIVSDTTFEATFAIDSFSITALAENGGMVTGAGRYPYGTEIELVAIADTLAGYHFANWSDGDNTNPRKIKVQKDMDMTAQFAINHYTIAYKLDDEVYGDIEVVAYNEPIALREAPKKEGYTFSGWSKIPATMPMGNVTVTGSFAINHHTITYMVDGDVYKKFENIPYASELSVIDNPEDKEGYTFSEWSELPVTMPDEDVVVTGSFIINEYEIAFVDFDGKVLQSGNVEYGQTPEYVGENPAQAATAQYTFKFNGWMPETKPVNGPLTYTAVYDTTVNQYAVTVVAENGSVKATTANGNEIENGKKVDYNTEVTLTATSPVSGYYFIRWSDGVTDNPRKFNIVNDTVFNAVYKKNFIADDLKYTLTSASTVSVGKIDDDHKPTDKVEIPAKVNDDDGIEYYVTTVRGYGFEKCEDLTEVVISDGATSIGQEAFYNCSNLTSVTIPNTVTNIGQNAFYNCSMTSVTIPASVSKIGGDESQFVGGGPFASCDKLESINVDAENANYISLDGVLYSKDTTLLVQYPKGKQDTLYVVHDSVKTIGFMAFNACKNLKYVAIPNGVKTLARYSFHFCGHNQKVTLPESCTDVKSAAYSKANGPTVYCKVSEEQAPKVVQDGNAVFNCKAIKIQSADETMGTAEILTEGGMGADGSTWFAKDSTIILKANPVSGYELESFKVGETVIEPTNGVYKYKVTTDATITATWKKSSLTLTYDANGGSLSVEATQTIDNTSTITTLSADKVSRQGYIFGGWNTKADGTGEYVTQISNPTENITLYAQWLAPTLYVSANGKTLEEADGFSTDNALSSFEQATRAICHFGSRTNNLEWTIKVIGEISASTIGDDNTQINNQGQGTLNTYDYASKITITGYDANSKITGIEYVETSVPVTITNLKIETQLCLMVGNGNVTLADGAVINSVLMQRGGFLSMSGSAYVEGEVLLWYDYATIRVNNQLTLPEGVTTAATIKPSNYARTYALLSGSAVATEYTKFRVAQDGGTTWYLNAEGELFNGFVQVDGTYFDGTAVSGSEVFIADRKFPIQNLLVSDHEVTQREYKAIMGSTANPSSFSSDPAEGEVQENRPVENVSWYAAIAYCNKRSKAEDLTPCYTVSGVTDWAGLSYSDIPTSSNETWNAVTCDFNANGYRLPTEAEWEYIARGGNLTNEGQTAYSGGSNVSEVAWYGVADGITHEVKKLKPNALGIYDMSGNVWEWCWDYYNTISSNTSATGPTSASSNYRSERGGWFGEADQYCYVNDREGNKPEYKDNRSGFRVVRTAVSSETCTVTIDKGNGTSPATNEVWKGYYISTPAIPTRAGYIFEGWYSDEERETPYNFKAAVTGDVTIYAKWKKIYAKVGGTNYFDKGTTISAISDASEDVTIELYGGEEGVKAIDLGKTFSDGIIAAIQYIQSVIDVTLVVPAETPIVLSGEDCKDMFKSCTRLVAADLRGFNTVNVTNMASMFEECNNLASLDLSGFNTSSVSDMRWMFQGCSALTSLDLSSFNTSNVTTMMNMFAGCTSLIALDLNSFNTSKVSNMSAMFWNCANIETINLDNFNTGKVTDMNSMFMVCSKLTSIDVSSFNTSKVEYMDNMFAYCDVLTTIYAATGANWKTSVLISSTDMFLNSGSLPNYSDSHIDATYARINGGATNIGYFTDATTCYYINNYSGNNNNSGLTATTPLATLDGALSKMQNATPHYKFYIDGQLQGPLTIGSECDGKAKTITLCGMNDESWLSGGSTGPVLTISTTVPVTITNLTIAGGTNTSGNGGGINMASGTKVTLGSGAIVSDNRAAKGGGIYSEGTLVLESGSVVGMADATTHATNSSYSNYATTGGGIDFAGGTVTIKEGAKVAYNFAYQGGGVHYSNEQYKPDDVLTISGGEIAYNGCDPKLYRSDHEHSWNSYGGGVFADGCTFNFSSGDIHHNFGCDGGGGLFLQKNTESAVISGGNIYDNSMHSEGPNEGSDILLFDACTLSMSGGNVYSSVANAKSVYVRNTSTNLSVSGDVQFSANTPIYLTEGTKVTIAGKLTNNNVATITPAVYDGETQYIQLADGVTDTRLAFEYSKFSITPNGQEPWYLWDNGIISNWIIQVKEENDAEHPFVLYEDQNFKKLDDRGSGEMISAGFPEVYVGNAEQVTADRTYYITMRRYHRISPKYNGAFQLFNYNPNTTFTFHITLEGENTIERYKDTYESRAFEIKGSGSTSKIVLIFDANTSGTLTLNGYRDFEVNDNVQVEYQMVDGCTFSGTADGQTFTNITDFFNHINYAENQDHVSNCSFTITK